MCVCVCVFVRERERDNRGEGRLIPGSEPASFAGSSGS